MLFYSGSMTCLFVVLDCIFSCEAELFVSFRPGMEPVRLLFA